MKNKDRNIDKGLRLVSDLFKCLQYRLDCMTKYACKVNPVALNIIKIDNSLHRTCAKSVS